MVDKWTISYGPDDTHVEIMKNGDSFRQFSTVRNGNTPDPWRVLKQAQKYVEQYATIHDEIVIHFSGSFK